MRRLGAALVAVALAASACTSSTDAAEERTLTVFAAASLHQAFTEIADRFEDEHDGVEVRLSFGGSSDLAAQIVEGAPSDVFAAADERTMAQVTGAADDALAPEIIATNTLQIAATPDGSVTSADDLTDPGTKVVVCAPQVPCGAATRVLLAKNGMRISAVSEEQSVTDVLGKVTSGEADAGLVYRTDVVAAGSAVRGIDVPGADEVVNRYPAVALDPGDDLAAEFVAFVSGPVGRRLLTEAGFGAP